MHAARVRRVLRRLLVGALRVGLAVALVLCAVGLAFALWVQENLLSGLPSDLGAWRAYRPPSSVEVRGGDGAVIDQFALERRVWVDIHTLPLHVPGAFVAAEDRRFYRHRGVDALGIARAAWANLQHDGVSQGGSTITQQLVKNLLVGNERSVERKLREAVLAVRLERELEKDELLELYINHVYLGAGNYGVEAAARDFFGVPAAQLDEGQAALIAGLIPSPSRYNPRRHPEVAAERRALVLRAMVEEGLVDPAAAAAFADDAVLAPPAPADTATDHSFITEVRRELRRVLPAGVAFAEGLVVRTAFDRGVQAAAEAGVRDALRALDARQGRRGALRTLPDDAWDDFLRRAPGLPRDGETHAVGRPAPGACFEALVNAERDLDSLLAGPWSFALDAADRAAPVRPVPPAPRALPLAEAVVPGDVLRVCMPPGGGETVALDPRPWAEGAAVVVEIGTGRVIAVVGGQQVPLEGFVRATQARRQPGSSFKPYVYAAALVDGRTPVDTVLDAPLSLPGGNGTIWSPKNYDDGYAGPLPLRTALARSLNTVAVRLGLDVGPARIAALARAMGVSTPLRADLTLSLGSSEVTPLDQALGYATLARGGVPTAAVWITALDGADGQRLGAAGGPVFVGGVSVGALPGGPLPRALPSGEAYAALDMLREVVRSGTARRAHAPALDRWGKTGTTNDTLDAWFVGGTATHVIAVWVGTDGTQSLGAGETGGRTALPAWVRIAAATGEVPGARLPPPDGAVLLPWNGQWIGVSRRNPPAALLPVRAVAPGAPLPAWPSG